MEPPSEQRGVRCQQALKMYDAVQDRIAAYEQEILRKLGEMEREKQRGQTAPSLHNTNKAKAIKKRGQEPSRQALYRMSGVDMTQIDAIGVETVEVLVSEYGPDLSRFPTEKQFVSHVTLAPRVPKSGGKPVRKQKAEQREHASGGGFAHGRALPAPQPDGPRSVLSKNRAQRRGGDIGGVRYRQEVGYSICRLLRWGQPYVDEGAAAFENRHRQHRIRRLAATARELGCQLTPVGA